MQEAVGWNHPADESDQWDGFNDSGMEHFRGNPIVHLAREICQNALDAADSGGVEVSFRFLEIETASLPNLDEFKATVQYCLDVAGDESERAELFFRNAAKLLAKNRIPVLQISDYNTTGIKGPAVNGKPFYAFMKASGQSKKESDTAGGSYGIGKFAPYVVSSLRTVFVSTIYRSDEGRWEQLTQGKSVLMSHYTNGDCRRGIGFWGIKEKCKPIPGVDPKLNGWLQRAQDPREYPSKKGTTITILGFEPPKNWRKLLAASVAENFFGAIGNGRLSVSIDEERVLTQDNIREFFDNPDVVKALEGEKNEPEHFENCRAYLEALQISGEVQIEETEHRELGRCNLRILVREGMPKKVCILRNGMLITDELNRLKSFSDFKDFAAVVECRSTKGNEFLRAMEPPRHDDFEPNLLPTVKLQKVGKKALLDLARWVRDMLKRHAKDPVSEVTTLDELKDFFGDENTEGGGKGTNEVNPLGEVIIRAKPLPRKGTESKKPEGSLEEGEGDGDGDGGRIPGDGGGGGGSGGDGQNDGGKGGRSGDGEGGSGGKDKKPFKKLQNVRAVMIDSDKRKLSFTPTATGEIALRLMRAGADTDHDIKALKSSYGTIKGGRIILTVTEGQRVTLDVQIEKNFSGSMKVSAYEV